MKKILLIIFMILLVGCSNENTENVKSNTSTNDTNLTDVEEAVTEVEEVDVERGKLVIQSLEDIDDAIASMTLEEKAGQMIQAERGGIQLADISKYNIGSILSGGGSAPKKNNPEGWTTLYNRMQRVSRNSSSGLPIIYGIDAVHGHNNVEGITLFPHNIGLGAANNPTLMYQIGDAVANDMIATGLNWNFAPAVSIAQDIRWGRSYESFSEETLRTSTLSVEYIKGLENKGIISTTKHFIGDGYTQAGTGEGTNFIDRGNVTVPIEKLLELYLPAYESAIKAGTGSIMASYNSVDGIKMHGHEYLLQEVLRGQLGFEGVVVSDWEAIHALPGNLEKQVATSINAGIDMLMQPYNWLDAYHAIINNVENGSIKMSRIDEAVRHILVMKYNAGLFTENFEKEPGEIGTEHSKAVARQAVSESMVLLENDGVLPLEKNMKIYLVGPASDNVGVQSGGWSLSWQGDMNPDLNNGTSLLDAFEKVLTENGGMLVNDPKDADVIVLAIGEQPYAEMMGDTTNLSLDHPMALPENIQAIESVKGYNKPVITILIAGRPLLVNDYLDDWDAFVMAWLPGTEGLGMTDVLFGDQPFTGTLPVTWPKTNEQASDSVNMEGYDTIDHQYKFGYGLQ